MADENQVLSRVHLKALENVQRGINQEQLDEMTTKELISFIIANPSILKRPLLVDHAMEIILVGYNENDLEDELI